MKRRAVLLVVSSGWILVLALPSWSQPLLERFDRADRNGDGLLTRQEFPRPAAYERILRRLDRNGDGVLQRSEAADAARLRALAEQRKTAKAAADRAMPPEPAHFRHLDIRYARIEGVDPNLLSLDLYVPKGEAPAKGRPVLIMIHGGGWRIGDKANTVGAKMRHFVSAGYIYASINYRLSPKTPQEDEGVRHPVHVQDCARAIAWLHDHVAAYGGDPGRLHLMGHSAGAHLAGLVATNERFLAAEGKPLSIIRTNVLLDTAAIDIPRYLRMSGSRGGMRSLYEQAFGPEQADWRDASPQHHVGPGKGIAPTLIFYGGRRMALHVLAPRFAASLTEAGAPSQAVDTAGLTHAQINAQVGTVGDPMTALIMRLHAGEDPTGFPATLAPAGSR